MAYQQILVAVDLTDEADEVMEAARSIANEQNATLCCITVVRPLARVYGGLDMAPMASGSITFETEALQQAESQLKKLAAKYKIEPANVHAQLGHPPIEIRSRAEDANADLIVIGTHGRHGFGLLLGSTANAVLHGVPCDVLAVKIATASKD